MFTAFLTVSLLAGAICVVVYASPVPRLLEERRRRRGDVHRFAAQEHAILSSPRAR